MMIGPNQISSYVASSDTPINFGIASIPANEGKSTSSVGVMDRFMVFEKKDTDAKIDAIKEFFDFCRFPRPEGCSALGSPPSSRTPHSPWY